MFLFLRIRLSHGLAIKLLGSRKCYEYGTKTIMISKFEKQIKKQIILHYQKLNHHENLM